MKRFQNLGRSLSNNEIKNVLGGLMAPPDGCTSTYSGCSYINDGKTLTCDYHIKCSNGADYYSCEQTCINGDGGACAA